MKMLDLIQYNNDLFYTISHENIVSFMGQILKGLIIFLMIVAVVILQIVNFIGTFIGNILVALDESSHAEIFMCILVGMIFAYTVCSYVFDDYEFYIHKAVQLESAERDYLLAKTFNEKIDLMKNETNRLRDEISLLRDHCTFLENRVHYLIYTNKSHQERQYN